MYERNHEISGQESNDCHYCEDDPGPESSIRHRNFRVFLVLQGDVAVMLASKFRGLVSAMYPFSDEERLCVCNTITATYLLLRLLLL